MIVRLYDRKKGRCPSLKLDAWGRKHQANASYFLCDQSVWMARVATVYSPKTVALCLCLLSSVGCICKSKWKFWFFRDSFSISSTPISSMRYQKTSYLRLSLDAQLENGLSKAANGCFCQQECAKCKSTCKCPLLDYYLYTIILCPFVKVVLPKPMPTPEEKSNTLESRINIALWINVAPGNLGKKNNRSPIYTLYRMSHRYWANFST